jgi:hypothetical protein
VGHGEAKKFRGDGMGFDVVELGEDRDKGVEVRAMVVLYITKVIHHQNKGDGTRDMAEKAGCGGFVEAVRGEVREKAKLRQLACLL